jgi:hypothetical protein
MAGKPDASSAGENEGLSDAMDFIYADNVSETKQKKWVLKNTIRGCGRVC